VVAQNVDAGISVWLCETPGFPGPPGIRRASRRLSASEATSGEAPGSGSLYRFMCHLFSTFPRMSLRPFPVRPSLYGTAPSRSPA
jgi:hypothetical protein